MTARETSVAEVGVKIQVGERIAVAAVCGVSF